MYRIKIIQMNVKIISVNKMNVNGNKYLNIITTVAINAATVILFRIISAATSIYEVYKQV